MLKRCSYGNRDISKNNQMWLNKLYFDYILIIFKIKIILLNIVIEFKIQYNYQIPTNKSDVEILSHYHHNKKSNCLSHIFNIIGKADLSKYFHFSESASLVVLISSRYIQGYV